MLFGDPKVSISEPFSLESAMGLSPSRRFRFTIILSSKTYTVFTKHSITKPGEIEQRIPQIAQALNIQDVLGKYPYQMSGGQQQRVAAARAMVTNPAIVLADEPTGALDSNSSRMLLTMLTELNERLSATILMVTHDAFSASYCNRILFIKDGQVFNELHRGTDTRKEFFTKILEVVSVLGGEQSEHM